MPIRASILFSIAFLNVFTCRPTPEPAPVAVSAKDLAVIENSFFFDLNFLKDHDSSLVVLESGQSKIIVSPKYQGKVFTSTANGDSGTSFGWVHYKAFEETNAHINAYGGENRVWIGPEGGRFSVFFPKDSAMVFENWKTPAGFDTEAWTMVSQDGVSVTLQKNTKLINYAGTLLSLSVTRKIKILDGEEIKAALGLDSTTRLQMVGYTTENMVTNEGKKAWTKKTGAPCLWILEMFTPSDKTHDRHSVPLKTRCLNLPRPTTLARYPPNGSFIKTMQYFLKRTANQGANSASIRVAQKISRAHMTRIKKFSLSRYSTWTTTRNT